MLNYLKKKKKILQLTKESILYSLAFFFKNYDRKLIFVLPGLASTTIANGKKMLIYYRTFKNYI
jgi:hypothetical protein